MSEAIDPTAITPETVTEAQFMQALLDWDQVKKDAALLAQREMELRMFVFKAGFKDPKEGTNKRPLSGGYVLNAVHKINRTIDRAALPTMNELLTEKGVSPDRIIQYKPELSVSGYKAQSDEVRAIVDMAIVAKPGAPSLEIVLPKRAAK